jgi:hypothetical protein
VRTLALLVAAQIASILLPCAHAQVPDSLPLGWERRGPLAASASYSLQLDRQVKHGGESSLRIQSADARPDEFGGVLQRFLADGFRGRRIRLSGYVRVAGAGGGGALWMRIDGGTAGTPFDNMQDRALKGTADWRRLEIVFDVPADAARINFGALLTGAGTLWVDDLELSVVDRSVPTTGRVLGPWEGPPAPPNRFRS